MAGCRLNIKVDCVGICGNIFDGNSLSFSFDNISN